MNIEKYINDRVNNQIEWYDKKSKYNQYFYKVLQLIEIILAAAIPVLTNYAMNSKLITFIIAIIGALIVIIESISKMNKYHENWVQYRTTCELLRYQKNLYETNTSPYNTDDETPENLFVKNIESIISSENNKWKSTNVSKKNK